MNRVIKFRVWHHHLEKFIYFTIEDLVSKKEDYEDAFGCADENYQQFTGLLDSKKKEIYEGDILKYLDCITQIIWSGEDSAFVTSSGNGSGFLSENRMLNYEIIGNIFENPKLLQ